jgi:serine/threonine-protein kinase
MIKATELWMGKELCPGYKLIRLLGRGGYGHVWEAEVEGKRLALKFLPCADNRTAAQEIRCIQVMKQLSHPNLVRIDQLWCHRGYIVITMEIAEGSLLDLLDAYQIEYGNPIPADEVIHSLTQAAGAIDFLNTRTHLINGQRVALQHGDIKPSNLLLFGETVKLCDFGLSALTTDPLKGHRRGGTFDYSAPEVLQGRLSDWSDQYALAVSYCQLRGGRLPFQDAKDKQPGRRPDLSMLSELERPIVARALATIPLERWPSCGDLMFQLRKAVPAAAAS